MPTLTTLASFNTMDGNRPLAGLVEDSAGDLFGTTENGGTYDDGTVFEIAKTATGYASTPTTLINFNNTNVLTSDGAHPFGPLLMDAAGNLFGTTTNGGANGATGTAFEIAKTATGYASTPTTLVSFNGVTGDTPEAGLITDAAGDLFGTTLTAGENSTTIDNSTALYVGTVFEIAKTSSGYASAPKTLAGFTAPPNGSYPNGSTPMGNLVMDAAGDLFGTTSFGATNNYGTVFEIAKTASGYAPITTLADLSTVGVSNAGLAIDAAGDLFGTTTNGGATNDGTVFEIAKTATGYASTPTILVGFNLTNGQTPRGGLLIDGAGNLWGTTIGGGAVGNAHGEVFEIAKTATGYANTPTIVVGFGSEQANAAPTDTLFADAAGNLFGTSSYGGLSADGSDAGTVFEVTGSGYVTSPQTPASTLTPQQVQVTALYEGLLNRTPSLSEVQSSTKLINAGTTLPTIAQSFLNSPEYQADSNNQFVTSLYQGFLGRTPGATAVQNWTTALTSGTSQAQVVADIDDSAEARARFAGQIAGEDPNSAFITILFRGLLGRAGTPTDVQSWAALLRGAQSQATIAQDFLSSPEYQAISNSQFVADLYQNMLGRSVGATEIQGWTTSLSSGTSRAQIAADFAQSPEAQVHWQGAILPMS